jgi:hypothetical protein
MGPGQPGQIVLRSHLKKKKKKNRVKWTRSVVQVIECLICKCKAMNSNSSSTKIRLIEFRDQNEGVCVDRVRGFLYPYRTPVLCLTLMCKPCGWQKCLIPTISKATDLHSARRVSNLFQFSWDFPSYQIQFTTSIKMRDLKQRFQDQQLRVIKTNYIGMEYITLCSFSNMNPGDSDNAGTWETLQNFWCINVAA